MLRYLTLFASLLLSVHIYAGSPQELNKTLTVGKDYEPVVATKVNASSVAQEWLTADKGKVEVIEFFSYGCPACNMADPALQEWLKTKPKDVVFRRVPVIFHPEWETYARTFYVLENLGLEAKLHTTLFNAIHQRNLNISTQATMRKFLADHGVKPADFDKLYQSFGMSTALNRSNALQAAYGIMEVPTIIVGGHYRTNFSVAKGHDDKLVSILNGLIDKSRKGEK